MKGREGKIGKGRTDGGKERVERGREGMRKGRKKEGEGKKERAERKAGKQKKEVGKKSKKGGGEGGKGDGGKELISSLGPAVPMSICHLDCFSSLQHGCLRAWWLTPIIPALWEIEAGESLDSGRWRLQ